MPQKKDKAVLMRATPAVKNTVSRLAAESDLRVSDFLMSLIAKAPGYSRILREELAKGKHNG